MRLLSRRFVVAVLLLLVFPVLASPPSTISYQGTLGTAGGQGLNQSIGVTFSLYDAVSGGAPLWTETQTITVNKGKFAVQLGLMQPLVNELFAQPVFLGITVDGDVEMAPRLPLTSAPYAIRGKALLRNTLHVSSDGTPQANAAALRAAVASIVGAAADNRYVVAIDAGSFDLGAAALIVPSFVELRGAGPRATTLVAAVANGAVQLQSHSGLGALGVLNTGSGGDFAVPTSAIEVLAGTQGVRIQSVAASSMPPAGTQGTDVRAALRFTRSSDLLIADVDLRAERSSSIYGLFGTFSPGAPLETGVVLRDLRIAVGAATANVRGFDSSGRMDLSVERATIVVDAGGIDGTNVVGFRTQLEVALMARDIDVAINHAANAPSEVRGLHFSRSAAVDLAGFRMRMTTGACTSAGFRNGVVFFNPPSESLLAQAQPRLRDGEVEVTADGCFAGAIFNAGSRPILDNVRIVARQLGATQQAVGYTHRAGSSSCDAFASQAGVAVLRHSSIDATAVSGSTAQGIDTCVDGLSIEHSTVTATQRAFTALHNTAGSQAHRFSISHSRLVSTNDFALGSFSDAGGVVRHTALEGFSGATFAAPDPISGTRSAIACLGVTTPVAFSAGPLCPCTVGPDCPSSP